MTQPLYANLHTSSKYAAQATPEPFAVVFQADPTCTGCGRPYTRCHCTI